MFGENDELLHHQNTSAGTLDGSSWYFNVVHTALCLAACGLS